MSPQACDKGSVAAGELFADLPAPSQGQLQQAQSEGAAKRRLGAPRLLQPNRTQIELRASDLESLLGEDHRARLVWGYVVRQNLSALLDEIKARGSNAGRARIDPRVLFALWLYAVLDGVGSGREVARLTREHDAYRWICGGVSVNYHSLNDFRANNEALTDELLSDNVAALAQAGAISLERVAQDGMRVRASAGAASFRREGSLQEHLSQARELVQTLKTEADADPGLAARRAQAAKLRAARERERHIEQALKQLPEVAAAKRRNGGKAEEARASTTDADARVMKMGDGGFRPAYNVQFATTCDSQVIVGMAVVNAGSDMAQLAPMVEQVEQRLGQAPEQWLVDGGFPAHEQIDAVAGKTELYAPVPKAKLPKEQPKQAAGSEAGQAVQDVTSAAPVSEFDPKPGDSPAVAQWRARMNTEPAREVYRQRAATAECVNALARNRGLLRMPVRGLARVGCVVGLFVLAHNLMRTAELAPHLIGWGTNPSATAAMTR
jgi:transposase